MSDKTSRAFLRELAQEVLKKEGWCFFIEQTTRNTFKVAERQGKQFRATTTDGLIETMLRERYGIQS